MVLLWGKCVKGNVDLWFYMQAICRDGFTWWGNVRLWIYPANVGSLLIHGWPFVRAIIM
jgi:hypothetical protein